MANDATAAGVDPLGQTTASGAGARGELPASDPALDATSVALPEGSSPAAAAGRGGAAGAGLDASSLRPFGPYSRLEPLPDQGAMGVVARGYNEAFERWELLKFIRPEYARVPEVLRQFQREGRILARLSHPNVVQVFAIYTLDGEPCLAMEFLEGESLSAHARAAGGRLPVARLHELMLEASRGLWAAHEAGLLHRDIKPENLFVVTARRGAPGGLKLIDFGLATADRSRLDPEAQASTLVAQMSGGTPLYMAPELWRGEEATAASDLFALGMSFFAAATGRLPYANGASSEEVRAALLSPDPFVDPREHRPELPPQLAAVLRRCLAKAPGERFASADELVSALLTAQSTARARRVPGSGPYRGLVSFGAAERDVFFGRDREISELVERLRGQGGVVVVGPSGSGKSSLVHAGVVPAIEDGALGFGVAYRGVRFEPRAHPVESLAAALARASGSSEKELAAFLRATPAKLGEALRASLPEGTGLVVVADQLEELSTLAEDASEVRDFSLSLASLAAVNCPELRLIATLRADLMDRLFAIEPLRPLLTRGFYPVRPLLGEALRRALEGPALAAGYRLEDPRVADAIVEDVARTPAGLPLLSFAMAAWWEARDEELRVLPTAAFRALGGLSGALSRHADSVLDAMGREERASAEQILVRLVSAEGTRARASRASLLDPAAAGPGAARALETLLSAKLVHESSGEVELVHEALIDGWARLRSLLTSSGEDRAFRERVSAASREWDGQGRPDGALWSDEQAARLLRWFDKSSSPLDQTELSFIEAVRRRESRRKLVGRSLSLAVVLVAVSFGFAARSNEHEMSARLSAALARERELDAAWKKAEAGRLRTLAEARTQDEPAAALRAAQDSYEFLHDPALDPIAWRARALGVAFPLPLHAGGALLARSAPRTGWIATGGADGVVRVLSPQSSDHALLRPSAAPGAHPTALDFSSSGDRLVVGASTGELLIGRAPGFSLERVGRCEGAVDSAVFSPSGRVVVRCEGDGEGSSVLHLDPDQHASRELYSGPRGLVSAAERAETAAVATREGKVTLYDTRTGKAGAEFELPRTSGLTALALSADGESMLFGEEDGTVQRASLGAKKIAPEPLPSKHAGRVLRLAFGPDGAMLSIGADRVAKIWQGGRARSVDVGSAHYAFIPGRDALALPSRSNEVLVVSLLGGELGGRLLGASAEITSIDADSAGRFAFVASRDGGVRAYSLEEATTRVTGSPLDTPPASCALSPDGAAAACASGRSMVLRGVTGSAGGMREPRREQPVPPGSPVGAIGVDLRGARVAFTAGERAFVDGAAVLAGARVSLFAFGEGYAAAAGLDEHGKPALFVGRGGLEQPRVVPLDRPALALGFTRDGKRLYAATAGGQIVGVDCRDPSAGRLLDAQVKADGEILSISVTDDGSMIALGSSSGKVLSLPAAGGAEKALGRLRAPVVCVAWSQSGRGLLAASSDRRVVVIDSESGHVIPVSGAPGAAGNCARSPIDDRFSFISPEGTPWLKLLDLSSVTLSHPPENPLDPRTMPVESWQGLPLGPLR